MEQDARASTANRPELVAHGVRLGDEVVPLLAGSVHYYHLDVASWKPALASLRELGARFVDTYVPWGVHERDGAFDFGESDPCLDVAHFLRLASEAGLYAILRPGPHVNAELTRFGLPERIVWDEACMARSASGARVVLPIPPLCFPLPSYASKKFSSEVARWYAELGRVLGGSCFPEGPIVMLQVDNEAALGFRDGVFDQDYHEDAISAYRAFLARRHPNLDELRRLYKNPTLQISKVNPPERKSLRHFTDLPPALDWAEAQEACVAEALGRMAELLRQHFPGALLSHNLPPGWEESVLDPALLEPSIDLVGADYYHRANARQQRVVLERTTALRARSQAAGKPCYAAELGVGFPPYFTPHTEQDSRFTALCALAYGVQGFNIYMAVDRDRWIGAPLASDGSRREEALFYEQLIQAVERTGLHRMQLRSEVSIVVPRELRRLTRVLHAFEPLSPTLLSAITGDALLGPGEQDLGLPSSLVTDTLRFLELVQNELERAQIPYGFADAEQLPSALAESRWTVLLSCSCLRKEHLELVRHALDSKKAITLGPHYPERDEMLRSQNAALRLGPTGTGVPGLLGLNAPAIRDAVQNAARTLPLTRLAIDHPDVRGTSFESAASDHAAHDRVAFLINPTRQALDVTFGLAAPANVRDALTLEELARSAQSVKLTLASRSIRMLELSRVS